MTHSIQTPFGDPGFLVLSGSRLYGIDTPTSDYDYVGALVEPQAYRVGLYRNGQQHGFEQHVFKGDGYEGTVYSVWKLATMFAEGNPTSLCLLYAPPIVDHYGIATDEFRRLVVSQRSGHRFLKYMDAQRRSMETQRSRADERKDLIARHGYDTKFAAHLLRLGYQGIEFLTTSEIVHPLRGYKRDMVLAVRCGEITMNAVLTLAENLQAQMQEALDTTSLPPDPDWEGLNEWVVDTYQRAWYAQAVAAG